MPPAIVAGQVAYIALSSRCETHSARWEGRPTSRYWPSVTVWDTAIDLVRPTRQPSQISKPMTSLPIDTPSLRLRHIKVDEAVRMMELNGEPSTRRWLPSHVYADAHEATKRMEYLISCYSSPGDPRRGPYVLAVDHLASGVLLGHVGFSPYDDDVEVSYAIAESHRRRGYGSEALNYACQWAADCFGLPSLLAITEFENVPSRQTLDRAGFIHSQDSVMRFQGAEQTVSHYTWRPSVAKAR